MTVSRSLRNDSAVLETTRQRVLDAARDLGYTPNPLLSVWMARVSGRRKRNFQPVLYYVVRSKNDEEASSVLRKRRHFSFAQKRAEELGFRLEAMPVNDGMTFQRVSEILWNRRCPGVIMAPFHDTAVDSVDMDWSNLSAITIGYSLIKPDLHRVCLNHFKGVDAVLTGLFAMKKWRMGYIVRRFSDERVMRQLVASYLSFRFHHPEYDILEPLLLEELNEAAFKRWFLKNKPEVLLAGDRIVLDWVEAHDTRSAAKRCKVIYSDEDYAVDPRIYGVMRSRSDLIGAAAVDLLAAMIYNNERGLPAAPRIIMIPTDFAVVRSK